MDTIISFYNDYVDASSSVIFDNINKEDSYFISIFKGSLFMLSCIKYHCLKIGTEKQIIIALNYVKSFNDWGDLKGDLKKCFSESSDMMKLEALKKLEDNPYFSSEEYNHSLAVFKKYYSNKKIQALEEYIKAYSIFRATEEFVSNACSHFCEPYVEMILYETKSTILYFLNEYKKYDKIFKKYASFNMRSKWDLNKKYLNEALKNSFL